MTAIERTAYPRFKRNLTAKDLAEVYFVISEQRKLLPPRLFEDLAEGKIKQLATEARALDATKMKDLEPHKRLTLAVAFVLVQSAEALDDLAEMFIKRMLAIHQKGKDALERYRVEQGAADALLVAGNGGGRAGTFFDGVGLITARAPVRVAVAAGSKVKGSR